MAARRAEVDTMALLCPVHRQNRIGWGCHASVLLSVKILGLMVESRLHDGSGCARHLPGVDTAHRARYKV